MTPNQIAKTWDGNGWFLSKIGFFQPYLCKWEIVKGVPHLVEKLSLEGLSASEVKMLLALRGITAIYISAMDGQSAKMVSADTFIDSISAAS